MGGAEVVKRDSESLSAAGIRRRGGVRIRGTKRGSANDGKKHYEALM